MTAKRLIAETITLAEAVDELEPMLRQREGFEHAWPHTPSTFRHAVARFVLARVAIELRADSERLAIVTARLEADYAALK